MVFKHLIAADDLQKLIGSENLLIFDCSFDLFAKEKFALAHKSGHIPTAFYAHLEKDLSGVVTKTSGFHPLPTKEEFLAFLNAHGMNERTQVVVYDNVGGGFAARAWWLVRWLGHEAVAVLDGGSANWRAKGFAWNTQAGIKRLGDYIAKTPLNDEVGLFPVIENISSQRFVVIDSRENPRFRGEVEPLYDVAGHIPGAKNRFFMDNLTAQGFFKDKQQLLKEFTALIAGADAKETIFYCGSGVTACFNILAMEYIGLTGARLYSGSWSQWIANSNLPVASGADNQ